MNAIIMHSIWKRGSRQSESHLQSPDERRPMAAVPRLSVREAFRGSCVLLTGVTGFVGSLVMEQLLRVCPEVERIYVLIRSKKSMTAAARLDRLVNSGECRSRDQSGSRTVWVRFVDGWRDRRGLRTAGGCLCYVATNEAPCSNSWGLQHLWSVRKRHEGRMECISSCKTEDP